MTHPHIFIDPDLRSLIPPLTADEYEQLEQNILRDGCRDPLALWDDVLLDGHNRFEICQKHGIAFGTEQVKGLETLADATLWIVRHQLGRRNISDFVRAELALMAKPAIEQQVRESQATSTGGVDPQLRPNLDEAAPTRTDVEVSKLANLSKNTIRKVEKIKKEAAPAVVEVVRRGGVSIDAAAQVAGLPQEQQEEIAAAGPAAIKIVAAEQRTARRAAKAAGLLTPDLGEITSRLVQLEEVLTETMSENATLRAENESLQRIVAADDRVAASLAELRAARADAAASLEQKEAEITALRERNNGLMNEKNEAVRIAKALQRKQGRAAA